MSQSRAERFSLKYALGLSAVLHFLLAPLFLISAALLIGVGQSLQSPSSPSAEQASVSTITVEHRPQPSVARHVAPAKSELASTLQRALARTVAHTVAHVPAPTAPTTHAQAFVRAATREARTIARASGAALGAVRDFVGPQPAVAATLEPRAATVIAVSAPPASASTAAIVLTSVQPALGRDGPNGGWGQNFEKPLVADESALADLRSKYHASATISVVVDENGHAIKIYIPDSLSSDARSEIERRLIALRYVPAECNGLRCQATLQILI